MKRLISAILVIAVFSTPAFSKYSGGSGTSGDPYQIADVNDLMTLSNDTNDYSKCFIMTADIDLDPNLPGNQTFTTAVIAPDINSSLSDFQGTKFTGIFDGNGCKIVNLRIDTAGANNHYLGLFGYIGGFLSSAQVKNLGIDNFVIIGTIGIGSVSSYLGGLCGYNYYGTINNCYVTGSVTGHYRLGGLCGCNDNGTISNSYATGLVFGDDYVGGLCGDNAFLGTVINCFASGSVSGASYLGGLCGANSNIINNCHSTCQVSGRIASLFIGGLCGKNQGGTIINSYATGHVVGGINSSSLGGLCGNNSNGPIRNCYATGQVTGGTGSSSTGGLCGYNSYEISDCNASGSVSGYDYIGGLCGKNYHNSINNSYATGPVSGHDYLGGLCGYNYDNATIANSYASGFVTGNNYLGGLCGQNYSGLISNCYATGFVSGNNYIGGLCGGNSDSISNCYAIGLVSGYNFLGGLCGGSYGPISNCYFYFFSGPDNSKGIALKTEQMVEQNSFSGFDFAGDPNDGTQEIWAITPGHCPTLSWQTDDGPLPPNYVTDTNLLGTGYAEDPFQINNAGDFNEFMTNNQLNCGYFVLTCDIDLSGLNFTTAVIDRHFGGHLDGGNHRIANVIIDTIDANNYYLGMFGVFSGSISNLGFENIRITGGSSSDYLGGLCGYNLFGNISNCYVNGSAYGSIFGDSYLGGLCGYNYYGIINNCYSTGLITGSAYLGGLCGYNSNGSISRCFAAGQVTGSSNRIGGLCGYNYYSGSINNCYATTQVTGAANSQYLGGLCGENFAYHGTISNSYATGPVSGYKYLGGLCGENYYGPISNCYSTGCVSGDSIKGGFCGNIHYGLVNTCFWDVNTSGMTTSAGGTGLATVQMQMKSTFTDAGWDFVGETINGPNDIWMIKEGFDYPRLTWQPYCPVSSGPDYDERIASVQVGSINNITDYTVGGYADYTFLSTAMSPGTGYPITVTNDLSHSYSDDKLGIWVDWNHDNDFDDDGEAIIVSGNPQQGQYWATITPPESAVLGNTRMRFRIVWNQIPAPCGAQDWSETEDYMITVELAGDFVYPDGVNFADFSFFAQKWLNTGCAENNNCNGTDLDLSGTVDLNDLAAFAENWLIEL
jgi:hypothetical protein